MEPNVVLMTTVLVVIAILLVMRWGFEKKLEKATTVEQRCQLIINRIRAALLGSAVMLGVSISVFFVYYLENTPENVGDVLYSAFIVLILCAAMIAFSTLLARTRQLLASLEQKAQQAN